MTATHVKLFVASDQRQAALFAGADEVNDWLRNCPADEVLSSGWHLLPKEEMISLADVEERGFLRAATEPTNPLRNWQLRSADLRVRLATQAAEQGDHALEADHAEAAAGQLAQFSNDVRIVALLLQAVEARLKLWQTSQDPTQACAIADLFAQLASYEWPESDPEGQVNSSRNQRFWLGQALQRQAELSVQAESQGDLYAAAEASEAVVTLQLQLANLPMLTASA